MKDFTYYLPCEIIFGRDAENRVGEELGRFGAKRVFLVYGQGSVIKSGLLERVQKSLSAHGILCEAFGGVKPNPVLSHAREGIAKALAFQCDFVLAVGGGSAIDSAKAIAIGAADPEVDIWRYWTGEMQVKKSLPVASVLTIPAAGSETSDSAVLTNDEQDTMDKRGLSTPFNIPRFAFMNPALSRTLPPYQLTCGIVDIMMHTMDRYFTPTKGNETTDAIAEALLRTVTQNGRVLIADPGDYDAMSEIMWCGSISHNGITGLGAETDFSPHKLGHELSAMFDVAHGASLSAVWGAWASYCCSADPSRFARFGKNVWGVARDDEGRAATEAIEKTVSYFKEIGAPVCFSELGIGVQSDDVIRRLAANCLNKNSSIIGSFKPLNEADAYEIYKLANR